MLAVVSIPWRHQAVARTSHEGALYAALDVIGGGNPALAQALHDDKRPAPFSAYLDAGLLRIGCLTTEVFLAVAGSRLAYKATREREDSFESILARAEGRPPTVKLDFVSPTSFAAGGRDHVLPDPAHVFGSLVRRWSAVAGSRAPELAYDEVSVAYASITGRKRTLAKCTVHGFTGRVVYRVPAELAMWYHALADFADYAGVGRRTGQGFGRVEYERESEVPAARANGAVPEAAGASA